MKKVLAIVMAAGLLAACSTNPDGSINWADNPVERAAQKINAGIQGTNAALGTLTGARQTETDNKKPKNPLDERVYSDMKLTYRHMLDLGYIRKNPDYPKHASEPYIFTSLNCTGGRSCFRNTRMIAPRP